MLALILDSLEDKRKVRLIYCNKTLEDVMLKTELDALCDQYTDTLRVHYVLTRPQANWTGLKGRVSRDMLDTLLPIADGERSVFMGVCGPKDFNAAVVDIFGELGYCREEYHVFDG